MSVTLILSCLESEKAVKSRMCQDKQSTLRVSVASILQQKRKSDRSVNALHYNFNPYCLEQTGEQEADKKKDNETLEYD